MPTPSLKNTPVATASTPACTIEPSATSATGAATVVIVDAGEPVVDLVESVFGAGAFDVIMVASSAHGYSQIRLAQPALVIVAVNFSDPTGFQVLSMLAHDEATRRIPVWIHAAEDASQAEAAGEALCYSRA